MDALYYKYSFQNVIIMHIMYFSYFSWLKDREFYFSFSQWKLHLIT